MSQSGSESDIWDYKSLKKTKRHDGSKNAKCTNVSHGKGKRKHESESESNKNKRASTTKAGCVVKKRTSAKTQSGNDSIQMKEVNGGPCSQPPPSDKTCEGKPVTVNETQKSSSKGHCPICQMPFSILVVQSQRWHIAECLETPGNDSKGKLGHIGCGSIFVLVLSLTFI